MSRVTNHSRWFVFAVLGVILMLSSGGAQAATGAANGRGWRELNRPSEAGPLPSLNASGDDSWAGGFIANGTNASVSRVSAPVFAVSRDGNGNLYAGGQFVVAGDAIANNIAKWNGTNWSPLGRGVSGPPWDAGIFALAVDSSNNLYAGGRFASAGGVDANNIARWDGTRWTPLGSGVSGCNPSSSCEPVVSALAIDHNGNVYVGGNFLMAGGVSVNGIAKWNGNAWQALGSGVSGGAAWVRALALDNSGNLFVGGNFVTAGGVTVNNIAKWNGSTWQPLASGSSGFSPDIRALATDSGGNLYAGGGFDTIGGVSASRVAKWNGSNWTAIGSPIPEGGLVECEIYALATHGSTLYAAGFFDSRMCTPSQSNIAAWNGSSWSTLDSGTDGPISALAVDGSGNLYAGGGSYLGWSFSSAGLKSANNVAKWNGSSWTGLGNDNSVNSQINALTVGAGKVYVGGSFQWAGGVNAGEIAKWDGGSWSAVGTGDGMGGPPTSVEALARDGNGNVYAGGSFTTADSVGANHVAKWNGSYWEALGSGMDGEVLALATDNNANLYAGGVSANCVARWDGSNWVALGGDLGCVYNIKQGYVSVFALAVDSSGGLYAGGSFISNGTGLPPGIAKWNGSSWSALGGGTNGPVLAIVFDSNGDLYAGGSFTNAGGVSANNVAKWNGSNWSAVGGGTDGPVHALTVDGSGNLYAGGWFTKAGGVTANHIAKWNGSSWRALGSGTNDWVQSLATDGSGNLYAGGWFTVAGGKVSTYFARCTIAPSVSDFFKLDDKNKRAFFSAAEFASHFTEVDGSTLAKIKILSLPSHGMLALGASNVSVNQEINVADLGSLSFTPETDWLGTTSFGWSGSDGNQYAPSGASVNVIVAILKYLEFPMVFR